MYNEYLLQTDNIYIAHRCSPIKCSLILSELGLFVGGMWRLESDVSLSSINLGILSGCGDNLMETVCRDACSGHDVPKVLHYL